ncbi:unnamed protein product (macronuclear) [Paramecium tetraurelia]|uniref:Uncharacterized protein n=1 Tax=Paramecium tetraurelia TaxID=5888 RepID=A0BHT8_PARTE|nr:uncharacterized protein GSPATT00029141001 [Paramecium tetraurelia]CAK58105.1 unnamed protein product [Paramecium tetraurelia]|eukprot:XP_001425503.1 hypothetical protein (macronuclear) [Paramecium tetraurelia strain d4-2]
MHTETCDGQTQEVSQELWWFVLAFNKDGSIMAGAAKKDIKIQNFENGYLQEKQVGVSLLAQQAQHTYQLNKYE